jgi:hypothetical protein
MSRIHYSIEKKDYFEISVIFKDDMKVYSNRLNFIFRITVSKLRRDNIVKQDIIDNVIGKIVDDHRFKYFISKENYTKIKKEAYFKNANLNNFLFMDNEPTLICLNRYFIFTTYALLKNYTRNKNWILSLISTTLKLENIDNDISTIIEIKG